MLQRIRRGSVSVRANFAEKAISEEKMDLVIALVTLLILAVVYAFVMWIDREGYREEAAVDAFVGHVSTRQVSDPRP